MLKPSCFARRRRRWFGIRRRIPRPLLRKGLRRASPRFISLRECKTGLGGSSGGSVWRPWRRCDICHLRRAGSGRALSRSQSEMELFLEALFAGSFASCEQEPKYRIFERMRGVLDLLHVSPPANERDDVCFLLIAGAYSLTHYVEAYFVLMKFFRSERTSVA